MKSSTNLSPDCLVYVGIDISKLKLSVACDPAGSFAFCGSHDYTDAAVDELCAALKELGGFLGMVVMEATGRYESLLAYALDQAGIAFAIVNPRRARKFAEAEGTDCKTDPVDAGALARFGRAMRPAATKLPDILAQEFKDLVSRRRQIIGMRDAERHRLAPRLAASVRNDIVEHIKELESRLSSIDKDIDKLIKANKEWASLANIITSIPCVGPVVCSTLLAELPELGKLTNKQIGKLAGLAPMDRQSGKYVGPKAIWGGRAQIRAALYMAALVGSRANPVIKEFYQRLIKAGKAKKCALTACMHKLLTILNAMARSRQTWSHNRATT